MRWSDVKSLASSMMLVIAACIIGGIAATVIVMVSATPRPFLVLGVLVFVTACSACALGRKSIEWF